MQKHTFKLLFPLLTLGICLLSLWSNANNIILRDGLHILVKESHVQGIPKTNSIQATINGHTLSIVFLENLGQVTVEVTTANGDDVDATSIATPNGVNFYITNTGSYIVTFTLPNGDVYYGEFEVTD